MLTLIVERPENNECLELLKNVAYASPEALKHISDSGNSVPQYIRIECDCFFAVGASDVVISLKPCDGLRELATTARAWDREHGGGDQSVEVGRWGLRIGYIHD